MNRTGLLLKRSVNGLLGTFGLELSRKRSPSIEGSRAIQGSFLPYELLQRVGPRENYFIHAGYHERIEYAHYDDSFNSDEWQDEVYRYAGEIAETQQLRTILDIGCGSGFKLMKYFNDRATIGIEVPESCAVLHRRYPHRQWADSDFSGPAPTGVDLVISADVIEHLLRPDQLLEYILRINPRFVVISTPDRHLGRNGSHNGPPRNSNHIREWSMPEFHAYLSDRMEIIEHFHSNPAQATQCALARPRRS